MRPLKPSCSSNSRGSHSPASEGSSHTQRGTCTPRCPDRSCPDRGIQDRGFRPGSISCPSHALVGEIVSASFPFIYASSGEVIFSSATVTIPYGPPGGEPVE